MICSINETIYLIYIYLIYISYIYILYIYILYIFYIIYNIYILYARASLLGLQVIWNLTPALPYSNDGAWVLLVQTPVCVPLLDLTVIGIHNPLHQVQYQAFIKVRPAAGVYDQHLNTDIAGHHFRHQPMALRYERLAIVQGLLALDQGWQLAETDKPA
jgi:hypothetical protein